jgi:hypothetical protein
MFISHLIWGTLKATIKKIHKGKIFFLLDRASGQRDCNLTGWGYPLKLLGVSAIWLD